MKKLLLFFLLVTTVTLEASSTYKEHKIRALYNSLDPYSIAEHLAFYELYPNTTEGHYSLQHAWQLLSGQNSTVQNVSYPPVHQLSNSLRAIIGLVNRWDTSEIPPLSEKELAIIEHFARNLPNRKLKGHNAQTELAVIVLDSKEIDLARAVFLSQLNDEKEDPLPKIRTYEAMLDLMALQIRTRLPENATSQKKIHEISHFIFNEMGFKFPPHSCYAEDIDIYTFLPSVLDTRKGVCLGVSILYLCIAQRLDLPLEIITPPGHIYVRYNDKGTHTNIETTARGVHIDSKEYLSIDTHTLQERTLKEVIGLAHINEASVYLRDQKYERALIAYQKAEPYLQNDLLLKELMGYNYLFVGEEEKGAALLKEIVDICPSYAIAKETTAEDYLKGNIDAKGIETIFLPVDETRASILEKKEKIEEVLKNYPHFRSGIFHLAITQLQLHQEGAAVKTLQSYCDLDSSDPTALYYLSALYTERLNYNQAWKYLKETEKLLEQKAHYPKALKELKKGLSLLAPE